MKSKIIKEQYKLLYSLLIYDYLFGDSVITVENYLTKYNEINIEKAVNIEYKVNKQTDYSRLS